MARPFSTAKQSEICTKESVKYGETKVITFVCVILDFVRAYKCSGLGRYVLRLRCVRL